MNLEKLRTLPAPRALILLATLLMCQPSLAFENELNGPTGIEMTADLVIARPVLLATTAVGAAVWLVALPFTALGGNVQSSAEALVAGPARATFVRCLGCSNDHYRD